MKIFISVLKTIIEVSSNLLVSQFINKLNESLVFRYNNNNTIQGFNEKEAYLLRKPQTFILRKPCYDFCFL